VAIEPIFSGGQLPANVVTTQQLPRGAADAAPLVIAQNAQLRSMERRYDDAAERATSALSDVGAMPTYDVRARVEPVSEDGQGRGRHFDQRA
jgi:hypothetical protein